MMLEALNELTNAINMINDDQNLDRSYKHIITSMLNSVKEKLNQPECDKSLEEQLSSAHNIHEKATNIIMSEIKSYYFSDSDKRETASIILRSLAVSGLVLEIAE